MTLTINGRHCCTLRSTFVQILNNFIQRNATQCTVPREANASNSLRRPLRVRRKEFLYGRPPRTTLATQRKSLVRKTGRVRKAGPASVRGTFNCIICGITRRAGAPDSFHFASGAYRTLPRALDLRRVIKSPPSSIRTSSAPLSPPLSPKGEIERRASLRIAPRKFEVSVGFCARETFPTGTFGREFREACTVYARPPLPARRLKPTEQTFCTGLRSFVGLMLAGELVFK